MDGLNYIEIKEVTSTNDHMRKLAVEEELPEGFVVCAQFQKNGRGLGSNTWESAAGKNITCSLVLRPTFVEAQDMFMISKVVSLGIIDYLNGLGKKFTIKWPNDIYYNNKKVGGILIENQLMGNALKYSIVGMGININQDKFLSNAPNPISLKNIFNREFKTHEVLNDILGQINIWYELLGDAWFDKINESYFSHLFRNTEYHDFKANDQIFHAKVQAVENDGQLILKTPEGEVKKFYFKEVEFVF